MPEHLPPSELGTKSYWDDAYTRELSNFKDSTDDEGTIWFEDAGAEERMLQFLEDLADEGQLDKGEEADIEDQEDAQEETGGDATISEKKSEGSRFLDLGTGNGHLLFALREDGWSGELVGVDYSTHSVSLASSIRQSKGSAYVDIQFETWDLLTQSPGPWLRSGFDVVLDKGTFDAISLSGEKDAQGRRIVEGYREKVQDLMKRGGRFLITSCNWTEDELRGWFEGGVSGEGDGEGELVFEDRVKYPSFTFGGKTGSKVVTLCFTRREN